MELDLDKILRAFILDRFIEEGNLIVMRDNFKDLSDEEFLHLETTVEKMYCRYQDLIHDRPTKQE